MHIDLNFKITPFRQVGFSNCEITEQFSFDKPLFYLVKRGNFKKSLDQGLRDQAVKLGVKINFNHAISENEADIVAIGPDFKNISVADKGLRFKTDLPDLAIGVVNENAAYKGYSYLLVVGGDACLCSCVFGDTKKINDCFDFTKKYFVDKYKLKINNPENVGGVGYFSINNIYKKGKSLFVGEAAGIQDFLAGFGMRTVITSGYLAAKSIIEDLDYVELANQQFKKYLEAGIVNRFAWEHADIDNYSSVLKKLSEMKQSTDLLRSIYNFNIVERVEYPLALNYIKKQYPGVIE
jgi:flavin-dependent dehydrogenase